MTNYSIQQAGGGGGPLALGQIHVRAGGMGGGGVSPLGLRKIRAGGGGGGGGGGRSLLRWAKYEA